MFTDKRIYFYDDKCKKRGWVCEYTFKIDYEAKYLYSNMFKDFSRGDIDNEKKVFIERKDNKIYLFSVNKTNLNSAIKDFEEALKDVWEE